MTLRRHLLLQFCQFKSLYPFRGNSMHISNLNNYLFFKTSQIKVSYLLYLFIHPRPPFLSILYYKTIIACEKLFLCLHYCNDRQFIPSSFDENDVLICTKNDNNDERKYSYATAFLTAKSKQNDEYIFEKKSLF